MLDSEAVQALVDVHHRKHRRALAAIEVATPRPRTGADPPHVVVPTSVRVEAGWNRRAPGAAPANRTRVEDHPLGSDVADRAAVLRGDLRISVADAHLATVLATGRAPFAVLTSDVEDIRRIAAHLDAAVTVVAL
ncbi:MAG: hypothetical protein L0H84_16135 [Pseudonocardia sp.]|nr:hypothetical protein [Pseudonocardia sp.]